MSRMGRRTAAILAALVCAAWTYGEEAETLLEGETAIEGWGVAR